MWVEIKKTPNLMLAEMWKEYIEGEGIPARIIPESGLPIGQEFAAYRVLVPQDKEGVIKEAMRKL
ncbi:MAG: hypothetical protein Q7R57_04660 [Dehalococcoidales bacterium]|nr:hypothetical protein [Dehalococcoidales bacterium]